tara:strand:+ start:11400 stop:11696 length:297 start_codon:yes stop_codon:yes gene_type:complete
MHFSLLFHDLKSFHFQTELFEACEWDEKILESIIKKVAHVLDNMVIPNYVRDFSYLQDKVLVPALKEQKIEDNQIKIIIKYIEHDSKFVAHILDLPEN